uniref:hypothetical protein n=1 Tax=Flavobacterium sp. TaxID=239 RepID=UPI00404A91FD
MYKIVPFFLLFIIFGMQAQPGMQPQSIARGSGEKNDTLIKKRGSKIEMTILNSSGKKTAVIRLKNNLKEGWQEKFTYEEKLIEKAMYRKGHLDGLLFSYDSQGKIREKKEYRWNPETKNSDLHGIYETYNQGKKLIQQTFKNNAKNGPFSEWNTNGILTKKGTYHNNLLTGKLEEFSNDGKKRNVQNYTIIKSEQGKEQSVLHGTYTFYKADGSLQSDGFYEYGKKTGKWIAYHHQTPYLENITYYKNDQIFGSYERYHPEGNLASKGIYYYEIAVNDTILKNINDGAKEIYYKNGNPQLLEFYKMGKLEGSWQRFYEDGTLQEERQYEDNLETGYKRFYDKTGKKIHEYYQKIIEIDGKKTSVRDGFEYRWNNGILTLKSEFKNGFEVGIRETFYDNGVKKEVVPMKESFYEGDYLEYHPNGKLKRFKQYKIPTDGSKPKFRVFGWSKDYDTLGNLTYQRFDGPKEKLVVENRYVENRLDYMNIPDLMEVQFFPNGDLLSLKIIAFYNQPMLHWFFYRDHKLRKIIFQDIESLTNTMADFTSNGQIAHVYLENPERQPPPASKNQVMRFANQMNPEWFQNPLLTDKVKNGNYELKFKDGTTFFKGQFSDDLPNGKFIIFDPTNRDTLSYKQYENGILKGYFVEKFAGKNTQRKGIYHENGFVKEESYFQKNGIPIRIYAFDTIGTRWLSKEYHDNGKIKSIRNEKNGLSSEYDPNGLVLYETVLLQGKPDWKARRNYHPNSTQIKTEYFYYKEQQDSLYNGYFANGKLEFSVTYRDGKRNGNYVSYFENGNLRSLGSYENDLMQGEWVQYKDGVAETVFYEQGKAVVKKSTKACGCTDERLSNNQIKFAQTVDNLLEYNKLRYYVPAYLKPVNNLNYGSIFFRNYQFSNGNRSGFSSMQLLLFKEFSFDLPANQQVRITLNPCMTPGFISIMDLTVSYQYDNPKETYATLLPKRIAVSLLQSPLKSADADYPNFTALFDTKSIEFRGDNPHTFNFADSPNACFTSGKIKDFLLVEIVVAEPLFFSQNYHASDVYPNQKKQFQTKSNEDFFGLDCKNVHTNFEIQESGKVLRFEKIDAHLLASGNWVSGNMSLKVKQKSEDIFLYKSDKMKFEFSLQNLKKEFIKNGLTKVNTEFDEKSETIMIQFYAE